MSKSILQKLYDGEFYPGEEIVPSDPEYRAKSCLVGDELEYLAGCLNGDDKARLEKVKRLMAETQQMSEYANFAYGFRAGMLIKPVICIGKQTQ